MYVMYLLILLQTNKFRNLLRRANPSWPSGGLPAFWTQNRPESRGILDTKKAGLDRCRKKMFPKSTHISIVFIINI